MKLIEFTRSYCKLMIIVFTITTIITTGYFFFVDATLYSLIIYSISGIFLWLMIWVRPTILDVHRVYFPHNATIVSPSKLFGGERAPNSANLIKGVDITNLNQKPSVLD